MRAAELHLNDRSSSDAVEREFTISQVRPDSILPFAFSIVLAAVDVVLVCGAFVLAFWLRFGEPGFAGDYAHGALAVALATSCMFALQGMYDVERPARWMKRVHASVTAPATSLVIVVTATYLLDVQSLSRLWVVQGWVLTVVALLVWRAIAQRVYTHLRDAFAQASRVLIVGTNTVGQQLARELAPEHDVVGFVDNGTDLDSGEGPPLLGPIAKLESVINRYAIDELVIALPAHRREQVSAIIARGFHRHVAVKILPDLADVLPQRIEMLQMAGRRYIGFPSRARVSRAKRALDLTIASLGLISLLPVLAMIALLIKLDSPGPVFFRQERVGKNGRRFNMIKFRSMSRDADKHLAALQVRNEASGPLFKIRQDPRVTRVGRVLRRLSLDEVPQIFNVLRGDMSLVGPRPPLPSEVEHYEDWQYGRLRAVPGMTGLWQVSGRSEVPFHDMVRLDLHYVRDWSFAMDLEILLRTIPAVIASRGAY